MTAGRTGLLQVPTRATTAERMPAAAPSTEPSHAATGTAGKAAASIAQPVERPALPRKPKNVSRIPIVLTRPTRELTQEKAGASAFAAMPPPLERGYSDRPGAVPRAALLPGIGGPFGGIW